MVNYLSRIVNDPERRKKWMIGTGIGVVALIILIVVIILASGGSSGESKGSDALNNVPLVDGYTTLAQVLRKCAKNDLSKIKFEKDLSDDLTWGNSNTDGCTTFTDLRRLRDGKVAAQIWFASASCDLQYTEGVEQVLEQIDVIKRLTNEYKNDFHLATSTSDLESAFSDNKISLFIGLNGGHLLDSRLALLRMFYDLGVRFLTLAPADCYTPWLAKPSGSEHSLTTFGHKIIEEAIRLGMVLDLSGLDQKIQIEILDEYKIPVIISQVAAKRIHDGGTKSVDDAIIRKVAENKGLLMLTFEQKELTNNAAATWNDIFEHLDYIANLVGIESVGLGSGFGVDAKPVGVMKDVQQYPLLFDELREYKPKGQSKIDWTSSKNLEKVASTNFQRILALVEKLRIDRLAHPPLSEWVPAADLKEVISEKEMVCRPIQSK